MCIKLVCNKLLHCINEFIYTDYWRVEHGIKPLQYLEWMTYDVNSVVKDKNNY